MNPRVVQTLFAKEARRLFGNRGAVTLAVLLVMFALLLAVFDRGPGAAGGATAVEIGGLPHVFVDQWRDGPWERYLADHVPPELRGKLHFRDLNRTPRDADGRILYPNNCGAIQMRTDPQSAEKYQVVFWHAGDDAGVLAPFETWFWRTSRRYFLERLSAAGADVPRADGDADDTSRLWLDLHQSLVDKAKGLAVEVPEVSAQRQRLAGGVFNLRKGVTAGLVMFALFLACVMLMPALTCEERERGVLLAQALSPASPLEILSAKALFYPLVGVGLSVLLAGITLPGMLLRPFFVLTVVAAAAGSLGIGMTIACVARTQREASMGAMVYLLTVTMLMFLCQQLGVPVLPYVFLEYHIPRMFNAALEDSVTIFDYGHLLGAGMLALTWMGAAVALFRRQGWQT